MQYDVKRFKGGKNKVKTRDGSHGKSVLNLRGHC
jgi:hypothetical protein